MIGKRIKQTRNELGISQRQLAGDEMTRAYISLIENGHATPSEKTLRIIANRLEKPLSYFLGDSDEENTEISEAILERAKKNAKDGMIDNALKIAERIFTITQNPQVIVETYFFILDIKMNKELYDEVLEYGDEALNHIRDLKDRHALVRFYMLMGKASFRIENFSYAKKAYNLAIKYSEQLKKLQIEKIKALTYLGTTNIRLGKIEEAIDHYLVAEKEASLSGDQLLHGQIAFSIGKGYFLLEDYAKSMHWTEKSILLLEEYDNERVFAIHNKAIINYVEGNKNESILILYECLEIYEKQDFKQKQASILEELAKISLERKDIQAAKDFCQRGIKLLESEDDGILRAKIYRILGLIFREEKQYDQGYYFLRMSYDLLLRLRSDNEASESLRLINSENSTLAKVF